MNIIKSPVRLYASAKAVILQFLHLPGNDRINNVVKRIANLTEDAAGSVLEKIMKDFAGRHHNIHEIFLDHFSKVENQYGSSLSPFEDQRKLLLGAFFTKEYSIQAAALFNPSIIPHPDQEGLNPGEQRFLMSLRATGEGHISSIVFQAGMVDKEGNISLDKPTGYFTRLQKKSGAGYAKKFILKCAANFPQFNKAVLDELPDEFTAAQANHILQAKANQDPSMVDSAAILEEMFDTNYELGDLSRIPIDEMVIFPSGKAESMGMEDLRLVKFEDRAQVCYYGTYTAYNGKQIRTQLIETKDFNSFKIRTLYGPAIQDKGMALFPEKLNGKYVMISRQGGENISIMFSEDLYSWEKSRVLMEPRFNWELLQLGNCGSPVKTERGWLLLTHGVGAMRVYVISAILLDLQDPSRIIGRLDKPLVEADEREREGYVPNVVYTCGLMRHGQLLIIPYALSDSSTGFITIRLDEILNEMKR